MRGFVWLALERNKDSSSKTPSVSLSTVEQDLPVGKGTGFEEGAEAVARHGGTLEFIAGCLKGREIDDRQKGGKRKRSQRGRKKKKGTKFVAEIRVTTMVDEGREEKKKTRKKRRSSTALPSLWETACWRSIAPAIRSSLTFFGYSASPKPDAYLVLSRELLRLLQGGS